MTWRDDVAANAGCYVCLFAVILLFLFPPVAPMLAVVACCGCCFKDAGKNMCKDCLDFFFGYQKTKGKKTGKADKSLASGDSSSDDDLDADGVTAPVYWANKDMSKPF